MGQIVQNSGKNAVSASKLDAPQQYLTFTLGGEMFAVAILNVKEIIEYGAVTEIPMMPNFIRGVINLRGAVVPVIALSCRFGGKATEVARRTCIVIIEMQEGDSKQDIGIMVDAVSEVLEISASEIAPPPVTSYRPMMLPRSMIGSQPSSNCMPSSSAPMPLTPS